MIAVRQLLASLLLPAALVAQTAQRRPLAVEDYYRLKTVGAPRLSPDGGWVAYTVGTRVEANNGQLTETWIVRSDGGAPQRIRHEGADVSAADWRPDGRLTYRAGGVLYAIDPSRPAGAPERAEATTGTRSPDGRWIALVVRDSVSRKAASYASEFERRHAERFKGKEFDWLNYKRDGAAAPVPDPRDPTQNLAGEIVLRPADGGATRRITQLGLQPSSLTWSADGQRLVFTANPDFRSERVYGGGELYSVTTAGVVQRQTDDEFVYNNSQFSPDGKLLAFTRSLSTDHVIRQKMTHGGSTDIMVRDESTGALRNLTDKWDLDPGSPSWSPDSRFIYFSAGIGGETHLFRVAATGGAVEQVTKGARRISGISFDRAMKKMAYTVGVYEQPSEVYVANIDGSGERKLTDVHADFLREIEPSRAEKVNYTSADGTPIEGWLILPYGYRANGGPYPLIVSNHGGPHSAVGYGYDFKDQYFAAQGYAVLEVNFRSSIGYGDAFKWGTWGAWGTKDGQDVMAGIDHVIANYRIDRTRVATTGHSYGGFMTNWLITQYPDRFAAAATGAGISNWISDYGMADIARTKETEFFGTPWNPTARDIMIKQSPLYYADRVKTPTLFVHGEVDYRVPFAEAEQFYFALKKNGVPAKIIMYEGQPHGIAGHWNNVHRMINELKWFDNYMRKPTS